jgi:DNA replication protein DnaC
MVGLEDVKSHFLKMKARIETARRQGVDLSKERFGVALVGNPGTGKLLILASLRCIESVLFYVCRS